MKSFILFLALFSATLVGSAANDPIILGSVTGTVMDNDLHEPIPYATITVKNETGEIVTGTVSRVDGSFILEKLPAGKYLFEVQFMGYKTYSEEVIISNKKKEFDLGEIYLNAEVALLNDVEVVAERSTIEQRIDRKVVNVGKDLTTTGATASEIMNNIPSVSVDQDGNIALRGNQNVKVLVDGKPTNMDVATLLKQIPSTSIKQIELITNPSAKHDPEGMSGIINIILHKNSNLGFNGNVTTGITVAEKLSSTGSLNMNYRKGKFNFYTNLGANDRNNKLDGYIRNLTTGVTEYPDLEFGNTGYLAKAGVDFYLNDKNVLSFYTNQNLSLQRFNGDFNLDYPAQPSLNYTQVVDTDEENLSSTYNFDFKHDFEKEGHNLELEADLNRYTNDEDTSFEFVGENPPSEDFLDRLDKERLTTLINLDYVNPLSETMKLELGAESRIERSENDYRSTNTNLNDVLYNYDRDIYSFYATFGQNFDKWSYQFGTRMENYNVEAVQQGSKVYEDDYFTFYPSAFLSYTPSEKNSFNLSYSRRVDRPSFNQVNPARQLSTPRLTVKGNPELQPQFTNSIELNYTRKLGRNSISGGVFYRMINDEIDQVIDEDPENPEHLILTFGNAGDSNSYGIELSGNFKPAHFWDLNANFNFYGQSISGFLGSTYVEKETTFYRFQANNSFKVSNRLKLQLFGIYQGPAETIQFKLDDMYFVNIGARYSFWDDKASLSLNVNDIFKTQYQQFSTTLPSAQTGKLARDSRNVYLGFSYRFGGGKNRALQRKQRDDNTASGGMF
ncbi:TonB-dependent receptor domain-containing protein [Salinimicrobium gaetbulicola]|uniref:TonB-dependent receptor domain-containing protein n=1 Tax=Salinimicrobium gaetbulicola TaxID=999702 RepID=A0ABW3IEB3_9FLAO